VNPYIPIYKRPPNQFIKYELRPFDDKAGHIGSERVAIFRDKGGAIREMVAQMIWDNTTNGDELNEQE